MGDVFCVDIDNLCLAPERPSLVMALADNDDDSVDEEMGIRRTSRQEKRKSYKEEEEMRQSTTGSQDRKKKKRKSSSSGTAKTPFSLSLPKSLSFSSANNNKNSDINSNMATMGRTTPHHKSSKTSRSNKQQKTKTGGSETDQEETDLEDGIRANVMVISGIPEVNKQSTDGVTANNDTRGGGGCTSALLKVLYKKNKVTSASLTFVQVLAQMRSILLDDSSRSHEHQKLLPQLTSSHPVKVNEAFYLVPPHCQQKGTKRAVLIGVNYAGDTPPGHQHVGCQKDCLSMKEYLIKVWGFDDSNIVVLMDDGQHNPPTKASIIKAFQKVASLSKDGDAVVCHYAGQYERVGRDNDVEEQAMVPVDFVTAGLLSEPDLYTHLVGRLARGVTLVAVMDGSAILDLPYKYRSSTIIGDGTFWQQQTQCVMCNDPQFPLICLAMIVVFCIIFFPMMFA